MSLGAGRGQFELKGKKGEKVHVKEMKFLCCHSKAEHETLTRTYVSMALS